MQPKTSYNPSINYTAPKPKFIGLFEETKTNLLLLSTFATTFIDCVV